MAKSVFLRGRDTETVLCDGCGGTISVRSIQVQTIKDGEIEVQFFYCPHCGKTFHILTTDNDLRATMKQRDELVGKAALFRGLRFREKSISKFKRQINRLSKDIERQAAALKKTGELLLEDDHEQKYRQARPEMLSGH